MAAAPSPPVVARCTAERNAAVTSFRADLALKWYTEHMGERPEVVAYGMQAEWLKIKHTADN